MKSGEESHLLHHRHSEDPDEGGENHIYLTVRSFIPTLSGFRMTKNNRHSDPDEIGRRISPFNNRSFRMAFHQPSLWTPVRNPFPPKVSPLMGFCGASLSYNNNTPTGLLHHYTTIPLYYYTLTRISFYFFHFKSSNIFIYFTKFNAYQIYL